ncbi:MAG: hypothetical protein HY606_04670 [Planctomycetes bacterium]|nr:hypothetical protein [Planctomycetota bacterium]
MNERERFIKTLTCSNPDRPSYGDYFAYESTKKRWEREGLPTGLDQRGLFNYFGFDHIDIGQGDKLRIKDRLLPPFKPKIVSETADYIIHRTEDGEVVKELKNVPPPAMAQFLSYPVTDRKSWLALKKRLNPDTYGRFPDNLTEIACNSSGRTTPLGAWLGGTFGYIRNWMGVQNACCLFYDNIKLVEEMIEHLTYFYSTFAIRIFSAGVELDWVMFWEDMAYKHGSLLSPEMYRKYCLPFYREIADILHQKGVKIICIDSDGNIEELIPLWLEVGINVLHPMEAAAGMDVRKIRRKYNKKIGFLGGIDKRALSSGREAIDAEVIPKVRDLLNTGGGFIVECDHAVPPDVSLDNYRYFRDLVRKLSER